jgi:hypothetical protein
MEKHPSWDRDVYILLTLVFVLVGATLGPLLNIPQVRANPAATATPTPTGPLCPVNADVILLIDISNSMGSGELDDAKVAANDFAGLMNLPPDQVGLVTFADEASLEHQLTDDGASVREKIDDLETTGIYSRMGEGIDEAQQELTSARHVPDSVSAILLLSDGIGAGPYAIEAAARARDAGTQIVALGFGEGVDEDLLREVASWSDEQNHDLYFFEPGLSDLAAIYEDLTSVPCWTLTPTATGTTTPTPTTTSTATPTPTSSATPTSTSTATPTATGTATSTSTPTNTPTPTSTDTPTSTSTPTPTATPKPRYVYLPLVVKDSATPIPFCNGDFEAGDSCWTPGGDPFPWVVDHLHNSDPPYSGEYCARLGESIFCEEHDAYRSWVYQDFTVPADATSPTLSFDYRIFTNDILGWASFRVEIRDLNNVTIAHVLRDGYDPDDNIAICYNDLGWRSKDAYDLSKFKGRTIRLWFEIRNEYDGGLGIWSYLDDVTVSP